MFRPTSVSPAVRSVGATEVPPLEIVAVAAPFAPSLTGLEPLPTFVRPPSAETCRISSAPRFQLNSDAVEWTLQIVSGQTCLRGLNHGVIRIDGVKLVSPPRSGQVTVKGPGFSYQANSNFEGQDAFILQVSGTSVRTRGTSDINVAVSVVAK